MDEELNEDDVLLITNLEDFTEETYLFSLLNLDAALLPEIRDEKDPEKRELLKEEYLLNHSKEDLDPTDLENMKQMYPQSKAKIIIEKYLLTNEDKDVFINIIDMMKATEEISRGMLYALFDKMHEDGLVDLVWDADKGDFAYTIRLKGRGLKNDEKERVKKFPKKEKPSPPKKPRKKK